MNPFKAEAISLRKNGYSYKMISDKLGLSKSTLSNWLSRIPFKPNKEVLKRVHNATIKSALHKQKLKFESLERAARQATRDIGKLSDRDLFMLGIGLYLGEGEKTFENIRIVNSDPSIIKLGISWLYRCCGLGKSNLRPIIYLYPDNNINQTMAFWSREIKVPLSQFGKTIVDTRTNKTNIKRRKLPYGTLHLKVLSNGDPSFGVDLHRRMMAWMDNCLKQIRI